MQKIIPSLVLYRPFEPFAYAFIRFCTGAFLLTHGVDRLFYSGLIAELGTLRDYLPTSVVGAFEIVGGLMIALGLLTRPIARCCSPLNGLLSPWLCRQSPERHGLCSQLACITPQWSLRCALPLSCAGAGTIRSIDCSAKSFDMLRMCIPRVHRMPKNDR